MTLVTPPDFTPGDRRFKLAPNRQPSARTSTRRNWDLQSVADGFERRRPGRPEIKVQRAIKSQLAGSATWGFCSSGRFYITSFGCFNPHLIPILLPKKGKRRPGHLYSFARILYIIPDTVVPHTCMAKLVHTIPRISGFMRLISID